MVEIMFWMLTGVMLLFTLLFLMSTKDLERLSKKVDKLINLEILTDRQKGKLKETMEKGVNVDKWIYRYRIPFVIVLFLTTVLLLRTTIYNIL